MITAALLNFFYVVLFAILSPLLLLGDVSSNNNVVQAIVQVNGYLAGVPFPLFLASLVASVVFLVAFEAVYWTYKLIRWIYRKIPGVS